MGEDGELQCIAGAASKAAEQTLRLAAIFALFSDPDSAEVTTESMLAAINLVQYNLDQHRLRYGRDGGTSSEAKATMLLNWLIEKGMREFSLREVMTRGPSRTGVREKKEIASKLLRILVDSGYIEEFKAAQRNPRYRLLTASISLGEDAL